MGSSEAGTSSGSEYQVFLSFRGPDTRKGFTDFLYHSLTDAGICVFRDDEELRVGERIEGALQRAIDNSRIYIPIFSRTYASSKWCLRELAHIVENTAKSNENKEILPIFFDVEPDDVKLKTPLYRGAIFDLECEKKLSTEQVDFWRKALMEVDAIKGWEANKYNGQGELIKLVVEVVVDKLKIKQKSVTQHLIGIDDRVVAISNFLDVDFGGVRLIQIHGMGGIGKTTLAKVVFNQLSTHFGKCCCFLENVREKSSRTDGLVELQKQLLSEIGNTAAASSINIDYGMKRIEEILCNKKVLIVLDDVDKSDQVEKLVGKGAAMCSGSRVLITTRNKDILRIIGLKYELLYYDMEVMSSEHALQLFSRHAFNKDSPSHDQYEISEKIVRATGRLPLTIEVIGSLLNNKAQEVWEETLTRLSEASLEESVFKRLKISYDALSYEQQQIFLDIACFFIGEEKTNAIYMWKDCKLFPYSGIGVLNNMSMIKIVEDNKFWMHDQLRDLGREIVRQENLMNPEEHSRLWIEKEILNTIRTKKVKNVQAMELNLWEIHAIKSEEIGRFKQLRFLRLNRGTFVGDLTDCFPELRWICWSDPPLKHKSTNMCLRNVVILEFSAIGFIDDEKLWSLIKEAGKLKVLSLDDCRRITKTPDFSGCPTLERLAFRRCSNLRKIDCSIGKLKCLIELMFYNCTRLKSLPEEIGDLQNLERFSLELCYEVKELPDSICKLKSLRFLYVSGLGAKGGWELPGAIGKLENLEVLCIEDNLKGQLTLGSGMFPHLQKLELRGCNKIRELPTLPTSLTHLIVLSVSLSIIPDLSNLTNLVELELNYHHFEGQRYSICTGDLSGIGRLSKLEHLGLRLPCVPAPAELASLPRLKQLNLSELNLQPFTRVLGSLSSNLKNLSTLDLCGCQMQEIQLDGLQLPNLMEFSLTGCESLERLLLSSMRKLIEVFVEQCPKLDEIHIAGVLEWLEVVTIRLCESFKRFVYVDMHLESSSECSLILASSVFNKLRRLYLYKCPKLDEIHIAGLQESLEELTIQCCESFRRLVYVDIHWESSNEYSLILASRVVNKLWRVELYNCPKLDEIHITGVLESLEELTIWDCESFRRLVYVDIHRDSSNESSLILASRVFNKLWRLCLLDCPKLDEIHIAGVSESLEHLAIIRCESFRRLVYDDIHWESSNESSLIIASRVFKKLRRLDIMDCPKILEIQVVGESESWEHLLLGEFPNLQSLGGLSNLKNLKSLEIRGCPGLLRVEGLDELEFLYLLSLIDCESLKIGIDVLTSKLPSDCLLQISGCRKLGVTKGFSGTIQYFKHYKESSFRGTCTCFRGL